METVRASGTHVSQRFIVFGPEDLAKKADQAGAELLPLSRASEFDIQGGPAAIRTVYITHPANPQTLVSFAEYDQKLAQDKLNEALRIFNDLGASHVVAKAYRSKTRRSTANAKLPVGLAKLEAKRSSSYDVAYEQVGKGSAPRDPRPIAYPQEPGFDAACVAVLQNGAASTRIEITKESQFSVGGSFARQFKGQGFELGAAVQSEDISNFVVEATFGPLKQVPPTSVASGADRPPTKRRGRGRF